MDARSVQQFSNDLLPLILLFAISITGLFLTASTHLMHGLHYVFLSQLHAITVIFTLLYLPFGKFFHIFQRPAQLGVDFYKKAGAEGEQAMCVRCGESYGSRMQMEDLKACKLRSAFGIRWPTAHTIRMFVLHCRRKNLALTQDGLWKSLGTDVRGMERSYKQWQSFRRIFLNW